MPNIQVEKAGVRWPRSISPNFGGNARCIAIDSAVRAAGRIVVWQLAAAEVSTAMISSFNATVPKPDPRTRSCRSLDSTSSGWLVRKSAPFTLCAAIATITKIAPG